jgi:hypothetical protein
MGTTVHVSVMDDGCIPLTFETKGPSRGGGKIGVLYCIIVTNNVTTPTNTVYNHNAKIKFTIENIQTQIFY